MAQHSKCSWMACPRLRSQTPPTTAYLTLAFSFACVNRGYEQSILDYKLVIRFISNGSTFPNVLEWLLPGSALNANDLGPWSKDWDETLIFFAQSHFIFSRASVPSESTRTLRLSLNDGNTPYEDTQTYTILSQRLPPQYLWCLSLAQQKAER